MAAEETRLSSIRIRIAFKLAYLLTTQVTPTDLSETVTTRSLPHHLRICTIFSPAPPTPSAPQPTVADNNRPIVITSDISLAAVKKRPPSVRHPPPATSLWRHSLLPVDIYLLKELPDIHLCGCGLCDVTTTPSYANDTPTHPPHPHIIPHMKKWCVVKFACIFVLLFKACLFVYYSYGLKSVIFKWCLIGF